MVEIVGFRGQTAPTTTYMKTNYSTISYTDSEAVFIYNFIRRYKKRIVRLRVKALTKRGSQVKKP